MAGSIKTFEYTTNGGDVFAIRMDESNGEAVGNQDYTDASTAQFFLPRNIEARYATYGSSDALYTKRIVLTDPAASTATLPATISVQDGNGGSVTLSLTSITGERAKVIPRPEDTAILDGDPT